MLHTKVIPQRPNVKFSPLFIVPGLGFLPRLEIEVLLIILALEHLLEEGISRRNPSPRVIVLPRIRPLSPPDGERALFADLAAHSLGCRRSCSRGTTLIDQPRRKLPSELMEGPKKMISASFAGPRTCAGSLLAYLPSPGSAPAPPQAN